MNKRVPCSRSSRISRLLGRLAGKKKAVVAVTGSFGSGKSTVVRMLRFPGAKVIDADRLAHRILAPGNAAFERVVRVFGNRVLVPSGRIDRKKLAAVVFADLKALKRLNAITHPEILRLIREEIKKASRKIVLLEAPLLFEAGLAREMDAVIVVKASRSTVIRRLTRQRSLTSAQIYRRLASQLPLSYKVRRADFVIDNNGQAGKTYRQVQRIRRLLWKNWI